MTIFASVSKFAAASALAISGLAAAATASADLSDLRGSWVNIDPNTRGLTQVIIGGSGDVATMAAWGSCSPSDCEWGEVPATPLTNSVSAAPSSADRILAYYDVSFKTSILSAYRRGDKLVVENSTTFKDGRADTFHTYSFKRLPTFIAPSIIQTPIYLNPEIVSLFGQPEPSVAPEPTVISSPSGKSETVVAPGVINSPGFKILTKKKNLDKLEGLWKNVDANTRGITKLKIKVNGSDADVRAWGSCSPSDCDWGWTDATPLTAAVGDDPRDANSLMSVWDSRIATRTAVMTRNGNTLTLQISTVYKDNRSDRLNTYVFKK